MSRIVQVQTNFTSGEIDPKIHGRIDLQQYYNALETAQNIVVQPQGGFTRRPGTKYLAALPSSAADGVTMIPFEFSVNDSYLIILVNTRFYIFKDGVQITNINASGNDYLEATDFTSSIIDTVCWAQSADTLILTHQTLPPVKLVRGATDADWTLSTITFDYIPKYAFTFNVTPGTDFTHDHLAADNVEGQITITAEDVSDVAVNIFTGAADTYVDQYINIQPQGRIKIIEKISDSQLRCISEVALFESDASATSTAIPAADWELEAGYEDSWSATRGYPRSSLFYEGRLYLGGSTSQPSTLWGSRVGQFFNFDPGESFDDAGVEVTLDTGRFNAIIDMYAGRHLQIFTTGGEFYIPQTLGDPITPSNISVQEQTTNGIKPGVRVENVDGATVFLQRQGKALGEFVFSDTVNGYLTNRLSLLSSHLLKTPTHMAVRKATSTDEGDRLLLVNSEDGTIACYTLLKSQDIIAPSEWVTDGEFLAIGVDVSDTYCVVKRTVDGSDVYYVELFDEDVLLDSAVTGVTGSEETGLAHLEAETVKVIRDGILEADKTVASGTVTFDFAATVDYQVGLNYVIQVVTLPAEPRLSSGPIRQFKKRILEVYADLYDTRAVTINGKDIALRSLDTYELGSAIQLYTGQKRTGPLLGFTDEGKITVTQNQPAEITVLALDYKLSVGQ